MTLAGRTPALRILVVAGLFDVSPWTVRRWLGRGILMPVQGLGACNKAKSSGARNRRRLRFSPQVLLDFAACNGMDEVARRLASSINLALIVTQDPMLRATFGANRAAVIATEMFSAGILAADLLPGVVVLDLGLGFRRCLKAAGQLRKIQPAPSLVAIFHDGQDWKETKKTFHRVLRYPVDVFELEKLLWPDLVRKKSPPLADPEE